MITLKMKIMLKIFEPKIIKKVIYIQPLQNHLDLIKKISVFDAAQAQSVFTSYTGFILSGTEYLYIIFSYLSVSFNNYLLGKLF